MSLQVGAYGTRRMVALKSPEALAPLVAGIAQSRDYVLCLGAGSITQWAYALPGELIAAG
jgi:UDP-N-acetylmuramate--alanine ligase